LNEASEGDYDLIILGEQSAHKLDRYLRGNFPLRVAEQAQCPVLFVKGEARTIQRLLVCDSGGGQPSLLSRFTAKLAELLEGEEEITVLHVMSQISAGPGVSGKYLRAEAEELIHERTLEGNLLQRDIEELTKPGIHARPKVRHGLVEDEILKEAQGSDYDLVVIGMYQGHDLKRFLLEDHTGKLLSHLDRPVLVVK